MSVKKYILFVLLLTAVITLAGYYYFGGFEAREQQLVKVSDYHFAGKPFKGTLKDERLEEIFYEVRQQFDKGSPEGIFTIVVLKEPETQKDTLEQFIGILVREPIAENTLPAGWETFTVPAEQAVRNTIRSHNLVMPKPQEIREEIQAFAREQNLSLMEGIVVEKYLGERHLEIEVPVKE